MKLIASVKNGNYRLDYFNNGTKIRIPLTKDSQYQPIYPEGIDVCLSKKCSIGCPYCHENAIPNGDFSEENIINFYKRIIANNNLTTPLYLFELAFGGGALSEIDPKFFQYFLSLIADVSINNFTINARELENENFVNILYEYFLHSYGGLGISYHSKYRTELLKAKKKFENNLVIHTIAGITNQDDYEWLIANKFRILILGYKNFRRGENFANIHSKDIEENRLSLENNLKKYLSSGTTISFDNKATEQLSLKEKVDPKIWNRYYMGDEGQFTMYIDLTNATFAPDSTYPLSRRESMNDSRYYWNLKKMFKAVRTMY